MVWTIALLKPRLPGEPAYSLLRAGIAALTHRAGCFTGQMKGDDGAAHTPLSEPEPRQLARGVDLRPAHIRQTARWPGLDDLNQSAGNFLACDGLDEQIGGDKRDERQPGQKLHHPIHDR